MPQETYEQLTSFSDEMRIAELEQQVASLQQTIAHLTEQVTICDFCGQPFRKHHVKHMETSYGRIVHVDCLHEIYRQLAASQKEEARAERRNEEALYGYELEG